MKKLNVLFLVLGFVLFSYFLYKFGLSAFQIIQHNINFYYLSLFTLVLIITVIPNVMRFKVILDSYGHKINLFRLIKQHICAFSVSYVTPATRLGGEPIRIYLMKKECKIDYKTGTTTVILDKFVEIFGSATYGIIGLILLISLGIPMYFRVIFGGLVFFALFFLFLIYYRIINKKGVFSNLFVFLRLNKIKKWNKLTPILKDIESKMYQFFKYHKKTFLLSFFFYIITGILFIVQFKLLLLSIGVSASLFQLILIINVWGLMNFVPSPGSLGFLEAGQFGLFYVLMGSGETGLAMTLILRVAYLSMTCLGFLFISHFGIKKIIEDKRNRKH